MTPLSLEEPTRSNILYSIVTPTVGHAIIWIIVVGAILIMAAFFKGR